MPDKTLTNACVATIYFLLFSVVPLQRVGLFIFERHSTKMSTMERVVSEWTI